MIRPGFELLLNPAFLIDYLWGCDFCYLSFVSNTSKKPRSDFHILAKILKFYQSSLSQDVIVGQRLGEAAIKKRI
jgi:hypothetical protein